LLIGWCGHHHVSVKYAEITSGSSFEPNNPTEQKLGYVEEPIECENDLEKKTRTPKS